MPERLERNTAVGSPRSCHAFALTTITLWGIGYPLTRVALQGYSATGLGAWRYLIASVVMLAIVLIRREKAPLLRDIPWFLLAGFCAFSAYTYCYNRGAVSLPSSVGSLLIATAPVLSALFARVIWKERLSAVRWTAVLVEFAGVLLLCLLRSGISGELSAMLWVLAAALTMSVYNLLQRRLTQRYPPFAATAYSIFGGTLLLLPFLPATAHEIVTAAPAQTAAMVYLALGASGAAFISWSFGLSRAAKTTDVTNYMFLTPLLATCFDFLFLREIPDFSVLAGGTVILLGLALFNFAEPLLHRRRASRQVPPQGREE